MLEKHLWNSSLLYVVVEIPQLVHEIRCSINEVFWKSSQNSQIKHKEQSSDGGALSKDDLQNFVKFTEKHLCRNLLFNKVAGNLKAAEAAAGDCKTKCY